MEFIDDWLENYKFEESRLSFEEKELIINSNECQDDPRNGSFLDSDCSDDEYEEIWLRLDPQMKKSTPFKELSISNNLQDISRSAPNVLYKETQKKQIVGQSIPLIELEMASNSLSNRFSMMLLEDKENVIGPANPKKIERLLEKADFSRLQKDEDQDSLSDSLILNDKPDYKHMKCPPLSSDSLIVTPELLNSQDGKITFYGDLNQIDCADVILPRIFQHHLLNKSIVTDKSEPYTYSKNRRCPNSSSSTEDNFKHHRYSRSRKVCGVTPLRPQYLCRLCSGQNWISSLDFNTHLAFSHGVLCIEKLKKTLLLPIPKCLFILRSRSFQTYYVKCSECLGWLRLGNSLSVCVDRQPKNQGLYYNYFLHYIQKHRSN